MGLDHMGWDRNFYVFITVKWFFFIFVKGGEHGSWWTVEQRKWTQKVKQIPAVVVDHDMHVFEFYWIYSPVYNFATFVAMITD